MLLLGAMNQKYYAPEYNLNITSSTNNGIDLYTYFKSKVGREPLADERVVFTVIAGVTIIGKTAQEFAVSSGTGWKATNTLKIVNFGSILGRGGDGGRGAVFIGKTYHAATNGQDGGSAIYSKVPMDVDNHSIIYGGGGGGGGTGTVRYTTIGSSSNTGNGGGGAPYGKGIPNLNSMDGMPYVPGVTAKMVADMETVRIKTMSNAPYPPSNAVSRMAVNVPRKLWSTWPMVRNPYHTSTYTDSTDFSALMDMYVVSEWGHFMYPIPKTGSPTYLRAGMLPDKTYVTQEQIDDPTYYFFDVWVAGNSPIWVPGLALRHAGDGTLSAGGHGGFGYNTMGTQHFRMMSNILKTNKSYFSSCSAAKGGNPGLPGGNSPFLKTAGSFVINGVQVQGIVNTSQVTERIYPGSNGGQAGYVSTGLVEITNMNGGVTKGR